MFTPKEARRFWAKVDTSGNCWIWIGSKDAAGYGFFYFQEKNQRAHRAVYFGLGRKLSNGQKVLHSCDNPSCVRPDHLFAGTAFDNMKDAAAKGRLYQQNQYAERAKQIILACLETVIPRLQ